MNNFYSKYKKGVLILGGSLVAVALLAYGGQTAIRSVFGLAVAQSSTKWNSLKDGSQGDNLVNGVGAMALYGFDGTNFDRVTITGGALNTVATGGSITPSDALTNPTDAANGNSLSSEFNGTTWDRTRHSFIQSTSGITTNAAGTTIAMTTTPMSKHTMVIDRTVGSTDIVEVDIECSLDGTIFIQIGTIIDLSNEPVLTSVDGTPCRDTRYNVVTVGSGNTLTIQLLTLR